MPELLEQPPIELDAHLFSDAVCVTGEAALIQHPQQLVTERPVESVGPYVPRHLSTEKVSPRERFNHSRLRQTALRLALVAGLIGSTAAVEMSPAAADSSQEYTITDDAAGGVYSRNSPHMDDTPRIAGKGIYPGDIVRLICGVTDGDPVGPNNTTWHKIINETRPDQGEFWENDHFFNTPNKAGELAPDESDCEERPNAQKPPEKSATDIEGCYFNMKAPRLNLTFSYSGEHRYYGNAWQAAENWTDAEAGIIIKPNNNSAAYIQFKDVEVNEIWVAKADIPETPEWVGPYKVVPPQPRTPEAVTIRVNRRKMDKLNDFQRTYILTHEVGHVLGLAHPDQYCQNYSTSIMSQGNKDTLKRNFNST